MKLILACQFREMNHNFAFKNTPVLADESDN